MSESNLDHGEVLGQESKFYHLSMKARPVKPGM